MRLMNNLSLKSQIMLISISTLSIILITVLLIYMQFSAVVRTKNDEYTREIVNQVRNNIISKVDMVDRVTEMIAYNVTVQEFLIEEDPLIRFDLYIRVENLIVNMIKMQDGITDILLIGENGNNYGNTSAITAVMENNIQFPDRAKNYYSEQVTLTHKSQNHKCFVAGTAIYSIMTRYPGVKLGTIAIIVDASFFDGGIDVMESVPDTVYFLLDRNTDIYASTDKDQIGYAFSLFELNDLKNIDESDKMLVNGKNNIAIIDDIPGIEGKIVSLVLVENLLYDLVEIRKMGMIILLSALILLSILWISLSWRIISPFTILISFMSEMRPGDLSKRVELSGYKEINTVASEFNKMLNEVKLLTDQLLSANTRLFNTKLAKKQSEISALQSQINPHFLYNTLEAIRGIAAVKEASEIRDMAKALGMIFRYSIKASDMVLLNQEIEIVKCFMLIQKIRFDGRISISYEIHPDSLNCQIPKMILQPIIENAVYHGLEPKIGKGTLSVNSHFTEGCLFLTIHDDGVGFSVDSMTRIKEMLRSSDTPSIDHADSSIGLFNVNNRIKLIYGDTYGITIDSYPGVYSTISIKLPCYGDHT